MHCCKIVIHDKLNKNTFKIIELTNISKTALFAVIGTFHRGENYLLTLESHRKGIYFPLNITFKPFITLSVL